MTKQFKKKLFAFRKIVSNQYEKLTQYIYDGHPHITLGVVMLDEEQENLMSMIFS